MTPALDEYISKVSRQVEMMETELRECDEVLQEAEIGNESFLAVLCLPCPCTVCPVSYNKKRICGLFYVL